MAKKKQKHLGKGLNALLGSVNTTTLSDTENNTNNTSLQNIPLTDISPNPYQPRKKWDESDLRNLIESIKANGVLQPIIVRKSTDGYQLIAGERRWRASKIAELETIPALVRDADESEMREIALVENIHRSDLNPIERAVAYKEYIEQFNLTQSQAAEKLGDSRSVIANFIRLLELPSEIQAMLINGELAMGHARAILSVQNDELRKKLANMALAGRLSVREVERLAKKAIAGNTLISEPKLEKEPHILDLESKLRDELGTKVHIKTQKGGKKGKIIVEFFSLDEFDRLTERMGVSIKDCN